MMQGPKSELKNLSKSAKKMVLVLLRQAVTILLGNTRKGQKK
jgi:hypothetical protein